MLGMNELTTTRAPAIDRRARRDLAELSKSTTVGLARTRTAEVAEVAKLEAVDTVTTVAMSCIAQQALAEAWHANRVPHAAGRLSLVADEFAISAAKRVRRLSREL